MLSLLKIDSLTQFLVLSLSVLLISSRFGLVDLGLNKSESKVTASVENNISYNSQSSEIKVLNPNYDIYYSIDGGDQFRNAGQYLDCSAIQNKRNIGIPTSVRWQAPSYNLPEISSVAIYLHNTETNEISQTKYFTNFNSYKSKLPIINVSAKHSHLFHEAYGIHVFGEDSWNEGGFYTSWWYRNANFTNRGMDSEREVNFQLFENGELLIDQKCGIRIGGNATRGFPQKSLKLYARKQYGKETITNTFFNNEVKEYSSIVLRTSGNDNTKTLFADLLMQTLAKGSEVLIQDGKPVDVFINGQYWGIYNLRERIDAQMIAENLDTKASRITILEGGHAELKEGDENRKIEFSNLVDGLRETDEMTSDLRSELNALIDVNSFADYIIFETFYANNDWPLNNSIMFAEKKGKWKWMLNDLDFSLAYPGDQNLHKNMFEFLSVKNDVHSVLFNKLIMESDFNVLFKDRVTELFESNLSDNNIKITCDKLKKGLEPSIENHIGRWRMIPNFKTWEKNCELNYKFLIDRKKIYMDHVDKL